MHRGVYTFVNRQSGTVLELSTDYKLVCPPSDSENQKWEIIPLGNGYMIQNVKTKMYLFATSVAEKASVIGCQFPVPWTIKEVHVAEEKTTLFEIHWPLTEFMFDLAGWGSAAPGTRVQLMKGQLWPNEHRCRLWRVSRCVQDYSTGSVNVIADQRTDTTHTALDVADIPEDGELILTTTTTAVTTIRRVTRYGTPDAVPSYTSSSMTKGPGYQ